MLKHLQKNKTLFFKPKTKSQSNWKKGYGQLINFLLICGINISFSKTQETVWHKIALLPVPVCMHFIVGLLIYLVSTVNYEIKTGFLVAVAYCFLNVTSLLLWYTIYFKRTSLRTCMKMFYTTAVQQKINLRNRRMAVNISLVVAWLYPEACFIISVMSRESSKPVKESNYLHSVAQEGSLGLIASRYITYTLKAANRYSIPGLVTVLCCTMYYRFSDLVANFNECLRLVDVTKMKKENFVCYVKTHQTLCELANQVERELSFPSFLLLSTQMLSMFFTLASIVIIKYKHMIASLIWESIPSFTLVPLTIVCIVYSASRVSKQHAETLAIIQSMHDKLSLQFEDDWKYLNVVERMKENSFPLMTAGGIVELRPGLVLTAFGSFLTYGLLILSLREQSTV